MAYITIHPIKTTLKKAIDYICDPKKTDNQKNISTQNCLVPTADMMFQYTKERHYSDVKNLAFHIVQSFKRGEVTTEQAQVIGRETMSRFLGEEYEYIIATHNGTEFIHNHIICNSVNMINGKAFSTEHDRKSYPAWRKICDITDNIAREYGISTVENALKDAMSKGKSHYEWAMNKQGLSWKSQLKSIIDETIRNANDFDSFLYSLREQNITVKYEPYKTKEGMILAFKMDGQKNFIYSKSLGKYYHENTIKERIERCVKRRGMSRTERRMERILNDDGKLKKLYDVDSFNEIGLKEWAKKENRQIRWDTLHELHDRGFSSDYELDKYLDELTKTIEDNLNAYSICRTEKAEKEQLLKYVQIYNDYKDVYDYYKNKTMYPDRYFRSHEKEILLFEEAESEIMKSKGFIPRIADIQYDIEDDERFMTYIRTKNRELRDELYSYKTLKYNLDVMNDILPTSEPVREGQITYSDIYERYSDKPYMERTTAYESDHYSEEKHESIERETPRSKLSKRSKSDDFDMEL